MLQVLPNRMKRSESRKSHSWWWDSHISPKNSKWLQEDLQDMDQHVKRMLKLIEEDADSFTKKVEIYYQKRPELINLVEDVYRMYRSLAERYDHVTGELRKNIPSDLQSQCSGITDLGSEPPSTMPSPGPSRRQSGHRAPGFDFFLGHNESPSLESETESDDSPVNYYSGMQGKVMDLEAELRESKDKLRMHEDGLSFSDSASFRKSGDESFDKIARYEEQLRAARRKIQQSEEEIRRLSGELQRHKSLGEGNNMLMEVQESSTSGSGGGGEAFDSERRALTLWEEHRLTRERLYESEQEVARLRQELTSKDQKVAPKEIISAWKIKLEEERGEVAKLQDRVARYKSDLADRDQEMRQLKEGMASANNNVRELELRCQSLKATLGAEIEQLKADLEMLVNEKDDLNISIIELGREVSSKDDQIDQMSSHLHQLHVEHVELVAAAEGARKLAGELRSKVKELEREVDKKQQVIVQGAEEKREAIRQLCFSLEHYRNGYHRLREVVTGPKVTASS